MELLETGLPIRLRHGGTHMNTNVAPLDTAVDLAEDEANELRQRIAALTSFIGRPIGVSEECLTPAELSGMLKDGLTGDRLEALISCSVCLENLIGIGGLKLRSPDGFVANAMAVGGRRTPEEAEEVVAAVQEPLVAFIGVHEPLIRIATNVRSIPFNCDIIPGFRIPSDKVATGIERTFVAI